MLLLLHVPACKYTDINTYSYTHPFMRTHTLEYSEIAVEIRVAFEHNDHTKATVYILNHVNVMGFQFRLLGRGQDTVGKDVNVVDCQTQDPEMQCRGGPTGKIIGFSMGVRAYVFFQSFHFVILQLFLTGTYRYRYHESGALLIKLKRPWILTASSTQFDQLPR